MRKEFKVKVIAKKTDKTVTVEVTRIKKHPIYQKRFKVTKKFLAHDPKNEYKEGDWVLIRETKPISKRKHFEVARKVK